MYQLEQTPGDGEGQGRLACCSPWGHKETDTAEQLNNNSFFWEEIQPYLTWIYLDKYSSSCKIFIVNGKHTISLVQISLYSGLVCFLVEELLL